MANIHVSREHELTITELKTKINLMMQSIEEKITFNSEWESESEFTFRRKGANGRIFITDSIFELNLNLGLMYRALSSQIETKIVKAVNQHVREES
ncbi:MAG: polyhydroxyalkanoic acid system family protein [Kangiellaceae bacterium]|nr:polyhydroxyalkanoic acid system family protein [Kangiellaceae bacterium]